ncbi:hypothetical protein KSP9073_00886 [Kushneria phyllosphaerae]|uniref:Uncharacterized protein n=1 Tax=Kushneria phyllosphaerae TaxID=2100822 RepID=A0A2R8CJF6_9GAMM|nr:hypothetical protein KSP9073_00886 [Kushneria phyllosphaerae]
MLPAFFHPCYRLAALTIVCSNRHLLYYPQQEKCHDPNR